MEVIQFLKYLKGKQIDLILNGDRLEVNFDGDGLPDEIVQEIRERKQEIIAFLQQINLVEDEGVQLIPLAPVQPDYSLSSAQQSLWVLSRLDQNSKAYNMQGMYRFEGTLNVVALEQAFVALINRHDILRTVFRVNDQGQPRQVILTPETCGYQFNQVDLTGIPDGETEMKRQVFEMAESPFDLENGPLLRVTLFKAGTGDHYLSYMLHHIISDGWSMKVMLREVLTLYTVFDHKQANPLPPLRIQYKDYAEWQQNQLTGANLVNHRHFWEKQFQGELPVLNLMGDFPRPEIKTSNGGNVSRMMNPKLFEQLNRMVQTNGVTLFVHLLAGINTLLFKLTEQTDIIIGTPIAGRMDADFENQIGIYLNTLAIRSRFEKDDSFNQLVEKIKDVSYKAFKHQVYPFDVLINSVSLPKDLSRNPLFDVMVILHNRDATAAAGTNRAEAGEEENSPALTVNRVSTVETSSSKFDLSFEFTELEGSIGINLEFNSDIFRPETANRFLDYLETIIQKVVLNPDQPLKQLRIVDAAEENWQLEQVNQTASVYPEETLVSLLEKQVLLNPEKPAVKFEENSLTYTELSTLSTEFAGFLQSKGITKSNIGLRVSRSEWMLVAIIGILKTGSAYVPIDQMYPDERAAYMVENSLCSLTVTDEILLEFIEMRKSGIIHPYKEQVIRPEDRAYIIYTSGSTGKPKGVMVGHRSVTNLLHSLKAVFEATENEKILSLTTVSFDIFITEVFFPLVHGMTVVLADDSVRHDPEQILELIKNEQITSTQLTPSRLSLLLQRDGFSFDKTLKRLIITGEAFSQSLFDQLSEVYHGAIFNAYGPTETCVFSSVRQLQKGDRVDIGEPLANTQMLILDEYLNLQPVGVAGELYIGGHGLALGYINQEALTSERFVPNPFDPQTRLYRTGDIGRWTAEGRLECFGRIDNQIKIRGYRIELQEIEAVLKEHADVKDAVVIAIHQADSGASLAAYVTGSQELNPAALRAFLATRLPDFMIPEYFVFLDSLPINPNGKVDLGKLPDPLHHAVINTVEYIAPENAMQQRLTEIWKDILKREQIGVLDNFFDLGGNSIKLIMLIDTVNRVFERKISYISAFRYPNIKAFANYLETDVQVRMKDIDQQIDRSVDVMDETLNLLNNFD